MTITKFLRLLRKSFGDARYSNYSTRADRFEVFKILMRLSLKSDSEKKTGHGEAIQEIFGFNVMGSSYRELLYLFREIFLEHQYSFKSQKASPAIIDCGANIGMAILYFKKFYPESKVMAFEANPVTFNYLKKNIIANNLTNVEIFNLALSDKQGTISFFVDDQNSLISSLDPNRYGSNRKKVTINCDKLSNFIAGNTFDLAKIDVEGAEFQIMDDLMESKAIQKIEQFIVEYHHNMNETAHLSKFLESFESSGFSYNIKTTFYTLGSFQDISISSYKTKA